MANKKDKKKVAIAVACQDVLKSKTAFSLVHALKDVDFDFDMFMSIGCDLIGARTRLVRQAIESGATHMLFVDYDMYFPPIQEGDKLISPISRMLSRDKDIIGAPYNFRSFPLKSTASPLSEISDKTQPYRCNVVATGFMLVKLSIMEKMEKPWFNFGRDANAEMVYGEDTWFCQQAIKAGFEVWADPTFTIKHIGEYLY
jgi:hypothetical protein